MCENKLYTTIEMLKELSADRKLVFRRYNDENFKVYSDTIGCLRMVVDGIDRPIAVLNYLNEYWINEEF